MKKVTIEGIMYLGSLVTNLDKTFTLKKANQVSHSALPQKEFMLYLQAKNLGDLQEVKFGGTGSSYSISKLTKDQKLNLATVKLNMKRAKALAAPTAENELLGVLLGK